MSIVSKHEYVICLLLILVKISQNVSLIRWFPIPTSELFIQAGIILPDTECYPQEPSS